MNINKNLKYNNTSLLRLFYNGMARKFMYNNRSFYQNADNFEILNDNWPYTVDAYNEIVSDISTSTKTYAYNKTDSKWYVKNDDDDYEQWGILSTVSSLSGVTTYTGKLVLLSTDNHEYKWNGNAWIDLGGYTQELAAITSNAVTGDTSPAYRLTVNGTDFALSGLYHDIEVTLKFEKTPALIVAENGDDQYIFSSVTSPDSVEYLAFLALQSLYFDLSGSYKRCNTAFSNMQADTEYTFAFTNGHYLGTQYGYQEFMVLFQDGIDKMRNWSASSNNTNTLIQIASKYIDIYEIKIYDDNGLIFDLTPIDDNGTITFHDSVNNINATVLSGTPVGVYDEALPEEYPSKPAPTLTLSKNSYKEALSGSYINGQTVNIYDKAYDVSNGKLVDQPIPEYTFIGIKNTVSSPSAYFDLDYTPTLTTNTIIKLKYSDLSYIPLEDSYLFGCNDANVMYSPEKAYGNRIRRITGDTWLEPSYDNNFVDRLQQIYPDTTYYYMFDLTSDSTYTYIRFATNENDLMQSSSIILTWDKASSLSSAHLGLFLVLTPDGISPGFYTVPCIYIGYVKIYENGTLVRDFTPCMYQTYEPALLDKVNGGIIRCSGDYNEFELLNN